MHRIFGLTGNEMVLVQWDEKWCSAITGNVNDWVTAALLQISLSCFYLDSHACNSFNHKGKGTGGVLQGNCL
jgi:hypothetical protein